MIRCVAATAKQKQRGNLSHAVATGWPLLWILWAQLSAGSSCKNRQLFWNSFSELEQFRRTYNNSWKLQIVLNMCSKFIQSWDKCFLWSRKKNNDNLTHGDCQHMEKFSKRQKATRVVDRCKITASKHKGSWVLNVPNLKRKKKRKYQFQLLFFFWCSFFSWLHQGMQLIGHLWQLSNQTRWV